MGRWHRTTPPVFQGLAAPGLALLAQNPVTAARSTKKDTS
jgi:hypothetical protein